MSESSALFVFEEGGKPASFGDAPPALQSRQQGQHQIPTYDTELAELEGERI